MPSIPAPPALPPRPPRSKVRWALGVCAGLFVVSSANHARLASIGEDDVLRHEVFAGINAGFALLVFLRPRWALLPTALLGFQQMNGHGRDLLASIQSPTLPFDWASLGVVLFFPALLVLLVVGWRRGDLAA